MKRRYTVYTDVGDFADIWAWSKRDAERQVWNLTLGRATNIRAVLEG